jgi:hypothetical protein
MNGKVGFIFSFQVESINSGAQGGRQTEKQRGKAETKPQEEQINGEKG